MKSHFLAMAGLGLISSVNAAVITVRLTSLDPLVLTSLT